MNYYLDTEFVESPVQPKFLGMSIGKPIFTIDLISIGIVSEDKREYYAISKEFDVDNAWNKINPTTHSDEKPYYWIRENVLAKIELSRNLVFAVNDEYKKYEGNMDWDKKVNVIRHLWESEKYNDIVFIDDSEETINKCKEYVMRLPINQQKCFTFILAD